MKVAVQRKENETVSAYTVYGTPVQTLNGRQGEVAIYDSGQVVVYIIERLYKKKAYVFRISEEKGGYKVPGVYPPVDLLVHTRTRLKTNRLIKYLAYARENKIDLNALPDAFFYRFDSLLDGRPKMDDIITLFYRFNR